MELTFMEFLKRTTLRILAQLRLLIVFDGVLFLCFTNGKCLYCIVLGLLYYCVAVRGAQIARSGVLLVCCYLPTLPCTKLQSLLLTKSSSEKLHITLNTMRPDPNAIGRV